MLDIIIVCEDAFGLEVYWLTQEINKVQPIYHVKGFLSDRKDPFGGIPAPAPILGTIEEWKPYDAEKYVMGIRNPAEKKRVATLFKARNARFATLYAPWALMLGDFSAGEGCIIANTNAKPNARFGDFVTMDMLMAESVNIGSYSTLEAFSNITSATIGEGVYVGPHAAIMANLTIGDGAWIEAGSIVVTNVKPGVRVSGAPARKKKQEKS
ncbi:MAG: hypothetical protein IJB81_11295 [Clostridia bacterium]|nr:hypothetical protein [Clostridia bacterium]